MKRSDEEASFEETGSIEYKNGFRPLLFLGGNFLIFSAAGTALLFLTDAVLSNQTGFAVNPKGWEIMIILSLQRI